MQHAAPVEEGHALGDLAHDAAPEAAAEAEPRLEEEAVERIAAELHGDQDLRPAHGDAVERLGSTRVIQRRFNVSVPRARVPEKASTLRGRSER